MDLEGLEMLSDEQCRWLLRQARVGRVAVSVGSVPAVFAVNYMVAGDEIWFFTAEGTKLRAATARTTVTFEVDHFDAFAQAGWAVMVVGTARERTESTVIAGAKRFGLRPWAAGDRFHLVAISMEFVSGRRIAPMIDRHRLPSARTGPEVGPYSAVSRLAQPPVRVDADWSLRAVADAMSEAKVSAVLVGRDQAIVTERDLTRALDEGLGPDDRAAAVCVTDLIYVDDDTTVIQAATEMLHREIRHLLLRNWRGDVDGVVSLRDVLVVLVEAMDPEVWGRIRETL